MVTFASPIARLLGRLTESASAKSTVRAWATPALRGHLAVALGESPSRPRRPPARLSPHAADGDAAERPQSTRA